MTLTGAFLKQAKSDSLVYAQLVNSKMPTCHRLHYLQMWWEKLCKAYLWAQDRSEANRALLFSHNVVAKVFPRMVLEHRRRLGDVRKADWSALRKLCVEIDRLHPQVDDGNRRQDNVEYPWENPPGQINTPCDWDFPVSRMLETKQGRLAMKAAVYLTDHPDLLTS